jgi:hypothetical protein
MGVFGAGVAGLGAGQTVYKSLQGHPDLVHFIDPITNSTIMQMDAVLSENHSREVEPTKFPIENGASISDHIMVAPLELELQCLITDSPIGGRSGYITEGIATAASAVLPAIGVATAATAYALHTAQMGTQSRSRAAFDALLRMQAGDPTTSPPTPPKTFDVVTKLQRYPNMIIKSLSVPRDPTMGNAILFQVSLAQLLVVQARASNVQFVSNKALATAKAKEGEKQLERKDYYKLGQNDQRSGAGYGASFDGAEGE